MYQHIESQQLSNQILSLVEIIHSLDLTCCSGIAFFLPHLVLRLQNKRQTVLYRRCCKSDPWFRSTVALNKTLMNKVMTDIISFQVIILACTVNRFRLSSQKTDCWTNDYTLINIVLHLKHEESTVESYSLSSFPCKDTSQRGGSAICISARCVCEHFLFVYAMFY